MINLGKKNHILNNGEAESIKTIGPNLNFVAKEAYKRLRTNIMFSFTGENENRIIGVTSSLKGEGKSTSSINLAYSLAEIGKRVLLIDADLRLSNIHKILNVNLSPGLSNLLVGVGTQDRGSIIQRSGIHDNLYVIAAGDTPPNPTELLSSSRMENILKTLAPKYEYIIVDLPPVDVVADALIVSKVVSGVVIVVRANYADKYTLNNVVRQFNYHKANIIGFIFNCAESKNGRYYKNNKYSKYYSEEGY